MPRSSREKPAIKDGISNTEKQPFSSAPEVCLHTRFMPLSRQMC